MTRQMIHTSKASYYYYQDNKGNYYWGKCGSPWSIKTRFYSAIKQVIDMTILLDDKQCSYQQPMI